MYFFPKRVTLLILATSRKCNLRPAASLSHSTTQFVVVSLCCVSLHDDMKLIAVSFFFFFNYCKAAKKKAKGKRNHYSVIEQNALSDNYMENILKCSYPQITGQNDRRDESLTGQVHDQAGHCPLTGRYFEHGETVADDLLRIAIYLPEFRRSKQCMKFPKWSCGDTLVVAE